MNKVELPEGTNIELNVPFTYEIGEEGPITGNVLWTLEDCIDEVRAELEQGIVDPHITCDTLPGDSDFGVSIEDVLGVASGLAIEITEQQAEDILFRLPEESRSDPSGDWQLWVENLIYQL